MRILTRIALAASAAAFALSIGAASAQDKVLKIGTEGAYPPFNNLTADGKLVGFDIDIANALCDEMKVKCEFVTQDWDGIIPALQAGKFDAIIASMSITPERAEKVDFTNKYYNTPPAIAAPKDTDIKGVTKEDLAGKTIGVATSTTHFNYAEKTYTDSTIKGYPTSQEYMLDLANGRLDAVNDDISRAGGNGWRRRTAPAASSSARITPVPEIHGRAPASRCARARPTWSTSSTPRSTRSAPTASTRKSTTSTSSSTSTAAIPDRCDRGGGELLAAAFQLATDSRENKREPMQSAWTLLSWGPEGWLDDIAYGVLVTVSLALATLPVGLLIGFFVALAKQSQRALAAACRQHLHDDLSRPAGAADAVPRLFRRADRPAEHRAARRSGRDGRDQQLRFRHGRARRRLLVLCERGVPVGVPRHPARPV